MRAKKAKSRKPQVLFLFYLDWAIDPPSFYYRIFYKLEFSDQAGGKIPKSETPGSDMRNLPKQSGIAGYEARNNYDVLASRRASQIRPFLFVKKWP